MYHFCSYCSVTSHVQLFATPWTVAHQAPLPKDFPGKNTGGGCHFLLQVIFWTQGSNPALLHYRWILYHSATQEATIFLGSTYKQYHMRFVFPCLTYFSSVQFRSIAQVCPTLCNPRDCSTPSFPVHHQLLSQSVQSFSCVRLFATP